MNRKQIRGAGRKALVEEMREIRNANHIAMSYYDAFIISKGMEEEFGEWLNVQMAEFGTPAAAFPFLKEVTKEVVEKIDRQRHV